MFSWIVVFRNEEDQQRVLYFVHISGSFDGKFIDLTTLVQNVNG